MARHEPIAESRDARDSSVIHDIGYQRYTGARLGRQAVVTSLYQHGLRTAFGLGRTAKAKIFPWLVVAIMTLVAVIATAVRAKTGLVVMTYMQFADTMIVLLILFVAIVGPELVSRDVRASVLPLYFSRPLHSSDYVLAKLAALTSAAWLVVGGPQLLMFLGGAFTTKKGMSGVWNELQDVLPALVYSGILAVVFSAIGLLIASMTGKRAFAAGGIVATFLVTAPIVGVLASLPSLTTQQLAGLASPATLVSGVGSWLIDDREADLRIGDFGPVYGAVTAALLATCVSLLLIRYRKLATR
jgi:ABC-2 type transport system permease protein